MDGKELRLALRNGDHVYGTAILSPSTQWPRVVASLGLDFVFIDTEHTPLNRETVSAMCHIYRALNLASLVRIPSPDPFQATMVLDGGAVGVIAPYIETAEQVRQLVGAVRDKPLKGQRLQSKIFEGHSLTPGFQHYLHQQNDGNVLIVNIESVPALEALNEILSVEGLDAILIGPHDLTCSLGIPEQYRHPDFIQTVDTIIAAARAHDVGVGIHIWEGVGYDQEIRWAKKGANLIMHSSDIASFRDAMQKEISGIRDSLGGSLEGSRDILKQSGT